MSGPILVVEDDNDLRDAIRGVLEGDGYDIWTARNGTEALTLLGSASESPSAVLLDLMMPVLNGWDFLERMDSLPRLQGVPIFVMTAYPDTLSAHHVTRANLRVLRKPLAPDQLLNLLRVATRRDQD